MQRVRSVITALVAVICLQAVLAEAQASASASPAPLTIAFISDQTGPAAIQDAEAVGVFKAAVDAQNDKGGVEGHKLETLVIDDQTSPR